MLIELYILFVVLGLILLIAGVINGSYFQDLFIKQGRSTMLLTVLLLGLSLVFFIMCANTSWAVDTHYCENQINQTELVSNTTTYTNDIVCETTTHKYEYLAWIFGAFSTLDIALIIFYIIKNAI